MLQPKRVKYRKVHRGRLKGKAHRGITVSFGEFGLRAEGAAWITARQIEAARRVLVRYLRRGGQLWIRIFPDKAVTKKPAETRMGGGKGPQDHWVAVVKPGRIMFEVGGLDDESSINALKQAQYKFSIKTRIVSKKDFIGGQA